jgi:hypothetical protein
MTKPVQQEKLEAAGWECGTQQSVELRLDGDHVHDEFRHYVVWASKDDNTVRVTGTKDQAARLWELVYQESKLIDPAGLAPDRRG